MSCRFHFLLLLSLKILYSDTHTHRYRIWILAISHRFFSFIFTIKYYYYIYTKKNARYFFLFSFFLLFGCLFFISISTLLIPITTTCTFCESILAIFFSFRDKLKRENCKMNICGLENFDFNTDVVVVVGVGGKEGIYIYLTAVTSEKKYMKWKINI